MRGTRPRLRRFHEVPPRDRAARHQDDPPAGRLGQDGEDARQARLRVARRDRGLRRRPRDQRASRNGLRQSRLSWRRRYVLGCLVPHERSRPCRVGPLGGRALEALQGEGARLGDVERARPRRRMAEGRPVHSVPTQDARGDRRAERAHGPHHQAQHPRRPHRRALARAEQRGVHRGLPQGNGRGREALHLGDLPRVLSQPGRLLRRGGEAEGRREEV